MGTDCVLHADNRYYLLDRWYVFDSVFNSGEEVSNEEALKRLNGLLEPAKLKMISARDVSYHTHWLREAKDMIENNNQKKVTFYADRDLPDDYQYYTRGIVDA